MNERIKELALKAGFEPYDSTSLSGNSELDQTLQVGEYPVGESVHEFAELIVRECLNNMENCDGDLDFGIWKTKQDFGVK